MLFKKKRVTKAGPNVITIAMNEIVISPLPPPPPPRPLWSVGFIPHYINFSKIRKICLPTMQSKNDFFHVFDLIQSRIIFDKSHIS